MIFFSVFVAHTALGEQCKRPGVHFWCRFAVLLRTFSSSCSRRCKIKEASGRSSAVQVTQEIKETASERGKEKKEKGPQPAEAGLFCLHLLHTRLSCKDQGRMREGQQTNVESQ